GERPEVTANGIASYAARTTSKPARVSTMARTDGRNRRTRNAPSARGACESTSRLAGLETGNKNEAALATSAHANAYGRGSRPRRVATAKATGVSSRAVASFESTAVISTPA